jgi:hypothetical protein
MIVKCNKCGLKYELQEDENPEDFQCKCGSNLKAEKKSKKPYNPLLAWWEKFDKRSKTITVGVACFIGLLIIVSMFTASSQSQGGHVSFSHTDFSWGNFNRVDNILIADAHYSTYLIPDNDFDYLNVVMEWYDSSGNVVKRDSVWSMNSAKEDISYKIDITQRIDFEAGKFDILVFSSSKDVSDDSKAIYTQTTTLQG